MRPYQATLSFFNLSLNAMKLSIMKSLFTLISLSLLILFFGYTTQTLILFLLIPLFLKYWLVPGGFAWRNYSSLHEKMPKLRGPTGWPLLGSLPEMGPLAHRKLASMAASMSASRLMAFSLGATRVVISSHPDTAREILCGTAFSDRPVKESARSLMFERAIGFAPSGKYWRHLRRLAATHMFSPKRVGSLEGLRQRAVADMVEGVGMEMEGSGSVRLRGILQKGSLSNILESVFGCGLRSVDLEVLGGMVEEGYDLITKFNLEDYFPLGFLDFYGVKRRCHRLAARVDSVVGQIVKQRKMMISSGEDHICGANNDFLSVLLALPVEDQLNDHDLVAVLWEMIFRGTDTVAILLEWIMARMVLHPEIQAKAQQELDTICAGSSRHVQDSDMPNLPYLQAIVKEVLRMHPPGPLLSWARLAVNDVHVGKYFVPAGTTAMVNMWAITHDPSIWKDPLTFRPERFIEEDVSIMGSDLRLAPFGSGRRACPGKALGLATVNLWLARLLQEFRWLPMAAQPVELSECLRLSLEMKKPLACRAVRRHGSAENLLK